MPNFLFLFIFFLLASVPDHPYFVGLQAHPEFCSRPLTPSPPFLGFVAAACGHEELTQQCELQLQNYVPPHPHGAMIDEQSIIRLQQDVKGEVDAKAPQPGVQES